MYIIVGSSRVGSNTDNKHSTVHTNTLKEENISRRSIVKTIAIRTVLFCATYTFEFLRAKIRTINTHLCLCNKESKGKQLSKKDPRIRS